MYFAETRFERSPISKECSVLFSRHNTRNNQKKILIDFRSWLEWLTPLLRGKEMAQQSFADPATVEVQLLSADEDVETGLHKAESFIFPEPKVTTSLMEQALF